VTALLVALAIGFAWSIGAHYTGAVMGMPHALRAIGAWQALLLMAPLAFFGATFASHAVEQRVGTGLTRQPLGVNEEVVVIGVAFAVTTFFNRFRMPTSTIQILVFSVVGVALATGTGVDWGSIGHLAVVWACAPIAAIFLGFLLTLGLDRLHLGERIGTILVAMGAIAAFAMGANDVSNASGALVGTGTFSPLEAGAVGGAAIAVGVLTWGKPLLRRVAFEIVEVDPAMATAAQLVQAAVVLAAVAFGFFTSMNQALVGAMAGAGLARGRDGAPGDALHDPPGLGARAGRVDRSRLRIRTARALERRRQLAGKSARTRHTIGVSVLGMATRAATPWGPADLVEELVVQQRAGTKRFASKVQLLETAKGERLVRFAYAGAGGGARGPITLRERDIGRLKAALAQHPALAQALGMES